MNIQNAFDIVQSKLNNWMEIFIAMLPNLIVATIVLVSFIIVSKLVRRIIEKLLNKISTSVFANRLIATFISFAILMAGIFVTLGILQLDKTVTSLLAGVGIIGLAISLAFQDLAGNFVSGVLIAIQKPFQVDNIIETNDFYGKVEKINLRTTELRTFQGHLVLIPNKHVFENPLINYSQMGFRRIDLEVGISYGDDLAKVSVATLAAVRQIDDIDHSKDVDLYFQEFGSSSINLVIRFWIRFQKQTDYLSARSQAIMNIKKAFDENDITIPFPIRTLDFGIKGGEKLSKMLEISKNHRM